jgi:hypothetical protein
MRAAFAGRRPSWESTIGGIAAVTKPIPRLIRQGASARLMLQALIDRGTDPTKLAELAKGRMRSRIAQLAEALEGRFNDHHRFMVGFRLARIDQISSNGSVPAADTARRSSPPNIR